MNISFLYYIHQYLSVHNIMIDTHIYKYTINSSSYKIKTRQKLFPTVWIHGFQSHWHLCKIPRLAPGELLCLHDTLLSSSFFHATLPRGKRRKKCGDWWLSSVAILTTISSMLDVGSVFLILQTGSKSCWEREWWHLFCSSKSDIDLKALQKMAKSEEICTSWDAQKPRL